jgi:hypothetical protein
MPWYDFVVHTSECELLFYVQTDTSMELWVSHNRGPFEKAAFPNEEKQQVY